MATNRADRIAKTYKVLKKHYTPIPDPPERSVLEHILYACCLENASYARADEAFKRIQEISFDWNEVRVTSASEIAESMVGYTEPKRAASNLRRVLQSIFETYYSFDIEHVKKQNLGKTIKELEKFSGTTPFIVSYVTQYGLAGHSIPIDRGALDVMYIAEVIDEKERDKNTVPGLERAISKKLGMEYGSLLHQLAADLVASPFSPTVRNILLEINPDGKEKLPKRKSRKKPKEEPAPPAKKTAQKPKVAAQKPVKAKAAKKKTVTKKAAPKKTAAASKHTAPKKATTQQTKKTKPTKKTKKSTTKQLAKRKPR